MEEEGIEARVARHRDAARALVEGLAPLGFEPLVAAAHRLPMLTVGAAPGARRMRAARRRSGARCSSATTSRSAAASESSRAQIWRIGLMGENAHPACAERLLAALRVELGD